MAFKPLIVGLPRSGFSLSASVLIHIYNRVQNKENDHIFKIRCLCNTLGNSISESITAAAAKLGLEDKLIFNENFRRTPGGPIWNNDFFGKRAYFRKYIGIKDHGDFTLLTSHPIEILDYYEIVHSHGPFSDWNSDPTFGNYNRFASVRNPAGIINSACHSINALASEYIQISSHLPVESKIREELAIYKLSDLKFFNALLKPLKKGIIDQIEQNDNFFQIFWENLVTEPQKEIQNIIEHCGFDKHEIDVEDIWRNIGFRNLTGAHKHNYRTGKAYVGDELESLTIEHIEIMKLNGFEELCAELGYELPSINPRSYNDFQEKVSAAIKGGSVIDPMEDRQLFNLAFQKSNIDFSGFGFRQYDWKRNSKLERSNIADPYIELQIWDAAELALSKFNLSFGLLLKYFNGDLTEKNLMRTIKQIGFKPEIYLQFENAWTGIEYK